jgi:hypothetical protein
MRCILGDQGRELLQEIHAGTCGHHVEPRTLVGKAFRQGLYCPTVVADSKDANSTPGKLTSRRKPCRQSPSHGPLQSGTLTWWALSDKRSGASPTSS